MKKLLLSTAAAIAIVAAPVSAFAQKHEGGAPEHSTGDSGGARSGGERMAPGAGSAGESGARHGGADDTSKTGVGGSDASKPTPAPEKGGADMKSGADARPGEPKSPSDSKSMDSKSPDSKSSSDPKANSEMDKNRPGEATKPGAENDKSKMDDKSKGEMDKSKDMDKSRSDGDMDKSKSGAETDKSRTESGSGSHSSVNISNEQRTTIRQTITSSSTTVKKVSRSSLGSVSISVGARIPRERVSSITIERLPPKIVEIVPEYRDYSYFVLDDGEIVIVDPSTYEIVYVIDA